jgi:hypothetical protein
MLFLKFREFLSDQENAERGAGRPPVRRSKIGDVQMDADGGPDAKPGL